jgi:predicted RNA methylase
VVNQIQRIIIVQAPEQFVQSVQRLLEFLKQQNISTEQIQKKVISQVIKKRAEKDEVFQKQLLQWEEAADEAARFSIVGQAVRLAIALIWSDTQSP